MPIARMKPQMNWIAMGSRHEECESLSLVALLMMAERRRPMVIAHW